MRTTRRTRPSQRRDAAEPFTGALVYLAARDVRTLAAARQRMEAMERRARLLSAANELLEVTPETLAERASDVLSRLGCLLVPALADFARIDVLREDGTLESGAMVHGGPQGWHPDGAPELAERVARGAAAVVVAEGEAALPERFRSLACLPLRARGRTLGVLTLGTTGAARALDHDDVRLAEEVARATAVALDNARLFVQAQAEARCREQALAAVSHEMRSPLQVISIASGALLRAWPEDPALLPFRRQVAVIADSAERMRRLAADLLDLSRVDAGHFSVSPEPVRVGVLLHGVLEVYRPIAEQKGIRLAVGTFPTSTVLADEERVHQVFANLIGNAVRFTPAGGTITLSAKAADGQVHFSVADTGAGIDPEHLPRVFERFWSAGKCRGCAGLGLAISRGIVEAHGGAIRAESRPGQGSTFTFTVPLAGA
ncbi:MAG TPA: GAF domain-containing sensor histidine kinase [Longimicrobium sp.]|nr:GAF domain-containing sensor histidine kinase [Longimicrobium sp.]